MGLSVLTESFFFCFSRLQAEGLETSGAGRLREPGGWGAGGGGCWLGWLAGAGGLGGWAAEAGLVSRIENRNDTTRRLDELKLCLSSV